MAQIRRTMWMPSFLTCHVERMLQRRAREGYKLVSVESEMGLYTFSFESAVPQTARFYVYKQDDLKRWGAYGVSPACSAKEEMGPYCEEMLECDGFSFVGRIREDVPDGVLRDAVAKRMKNTARYHMECFVVWIILPIAIQIVNLLSNTPWRWWNTAVGVLLMGAIYLYHLIAAAVSFFWGRAA